MDTLFLLHQKEQRVHQKDGAGLGDWLLRQIFYIAQGIGREVNGAFAHALVGLDFFFDTAAKKAAAEQEQCGECVFSGTFFQGCIACHHAQIY